MRSGSLRCRIEIQFNNKGPEWGNEDNWQLFQRVWAKIDFSSGGEGVADNQQTSKTQGKVEIRYIQGVKSDMRIFFINRIFEIISIVNPEEKNRKLILSVEEILR